MSAETSGIHYFASPLVVVHYHLGSNFLYLDLIAAALLIALSFAHEDRVYRTPSSDPRR